MALLIWWCSVYRRISLIKRTKRTNLESKANLHGPEIIIVEFCFDCVAEFFMPWNYFGPLYNFQFSKQRFRSKKKFLYDNIFLAYGYSENQLTIPTIMILVGFFWRIHNLWSYLRATRTLLETVAPPAPSGGQHRRAGSALESPMSVSKWENRSWLV